MEDLVSSVLLADSSRNISNGSAPFDSNSKLSPSAGGVRDGEEVQQDVAVFVGVSIHGPQHPRNELVGLSAIHRSCRTNRVRSHKTISLARAHALQIWPVQFYSSVDGVVTDHMRALVSEEDLARDQIDDNDSGGSSRA